MPQGHLQPSLSIAVDGGLSSDSFRARSVPTTEESGQHRTRCPSLSVPNRSDEVTAALHLTHALRGRGWSDIDFATVRAQSMKSCATGPSVRFFNVKIPTGLVAVGKSTGKRFSAGWLARNVNKE